jgi:hypothetical protein
VNFKKLIQTDKFALNVGINMILADGIELENGFLVKYYSDNNFYG